MDYQETPIPPLPPYDRREYDIPPLKPNNWLLPSIVATILCCMPFGVVGLIFAIKVDGLYYNGRYDEAQSASQKAKMWTLVSAGAALLYWVIWLMLFATGTLPEYMENIIENNASGYNF